MTLTTLPSESTGDCAALGWPGALRNGLLALWRRAHAASVPRALAFIGIPLALM